MDLCVMEQDSVQPLIRGVKVGSHTFNIHTTSCDVRKERGLVSYIIRSCCIFSDTGLHLICKVVRVLGKQIFQYT